MATQGDNQTPTVIHENDCELEAWDDDIRGRVQWRTLISGDRTPTTGVTCGIAYLPVGASKNAALHQHAAVEVYYILEGSGVLSIDGAEHDVSAGSTAFIPGNALHGLMNTGSSPMRLLYVFPVDSFSEVEYIFHNAPK